LIGKSYADIAAVRQLGSGSRKASEQRRSMATKDGYSGPPLEKAGNSRKWRRCEFTKPNTLKHNSGNKYDDK
jgi:hypothetical protein